jgi:uncharacterized protein (TIGR02300 family)
VAKPELGTKRVCINCAAKFYDLNKDPITCPKCGTEFTVASLMPRGRPDAPRAPVREAEPEAAEPAEAEFVSLEEADAEQQSSPKKAPAEAADTDEDVEIDESLDDAAFIEETEDEDTDVTEIIGGDIEDDEET